MAHVTNHGAVVLFYATAIDEFLHPFGENCRSFAVFGTDAFDSCKSPVFFNIFVCNDLCHIGLIEEYDGIQIADRGQNFDFFRGQWGRPIDNAEHDICFFNIIASTLHTKGFHRILCVSNTCRIDEAQRNAFYGHIFFNTVPRRPRNIRYNSAVFAQESVHKTRFTCIWTAYNNRRNTIANKATCVRCGQQIIHSFQNRL